jgi:membrane-associated phospholipid phosphatase
MGVQLAATGLGDLFPATCVAVAITGWCWVRLNRLIAAVFATCFVGAVGAAFILKLVSNAVSPPLDVAGIWALSQGAPSGHATCAAMVYGGLAILFARAFKGVWVGLGFLYSLAVIAIVCVTRLSLHTHTIPDVAAGLAVGFSFAVLFNRALRAQLRPTPSTAAAELLTVVMVVAVLALASGIRISSTQFL